jgi:hypothetical protein
MTAIIGLVSVPAKSPLQLWLAQYPHLSPVLAAYSGFLVYCMSEFLWRYRSADLNGRMLVSLLNRGIIALLLSLLLSAMNTEAEAVFVAIAFIVGVFPQTGIQAVAKLAKSNVETLTLDPASNFRKVPEIDIWKEASLAELGISNLDDLAKTDLPHLLLAVGIQPRVLLRAVDRAVLAEELSTPPVRTPASAGSPERGDPVDALDALGVRTASNLVLFLTGSEAFENSTSQPSPANDWRTLTPEDKTARSAKVQSCGVDNPDFVIDLLRSHANVRYILRCKQTYRDT